ncbi:hypothetical protein [Candidatus Uabimicrobium sp. HlEnr_7]|uniref:hypothetical protein n=1 Tax=Candidatus Uabimicrobium helgolandensis TaxID=3095367 RepID=UPI003558D9D1
MANKLLLLMMVFLSIPLFCQESQETERVIYVPYQQLEQLFKNNPDQGIYLSYAEYQKLKTLAKKGEGQPEELPALVLISKAHYLCKVQQQFLHVTAKYTVDTLRPGWHKFPLNFEGIGIEKALLNGKPAFLSLEGNSYGLIFEREQAGQDTLEISFVVPIHFGKTMNALVEFNVPRSPIAELELSLPSSEETPNMKVEITPSLTNTTVKTEKETNIKALLGNNNKIRIAWQSEVERKVEIKQIVHAENITSLKIGENFLNITTQIRYDVIQGQINQVKVKVPQGFTVYSVKSTIGQGINDWNTQESTNTLQVNFLENVEDRGEGKVDLLLEIKLEKIVKDLTGQFSLPRLEATGVEREKGYYTISVNDLHDLKIISRKDISQLELSDLPAHIAQQGINFPFKYLKTPYEITVELTKIDPVYEVITNTRAYLEETTYDLNTHFEYNVKKSRIFQTQISIPKGFVLRELSAHEQNSSEDQIKERFVKEDENVVAITFKKAITAGSKLIIKAHLQKKFVEKDTREIELPVFQVIGAKREQGNIGLGVKPSFSITTIAGSQKNVLPLDKELLFEKGSKPSKESVDIGLRYHSHPIAAKFKIEKRDPYVTAEVYDYISINDNMLKHEFHIFYSVEFTGVKEFSFTLPSAIAVKVPKSRVTDMTKSIKEIDIIEQKESNTHLYKVATQKDLKGLYKLIVSYEENLQQIEEGKVLKLDVFELKTQNTKRENGFLVIKKNNNFSLNFSDVTLLETTDINDQNFSPRGNKTDVLAIFKYFSHGYKLSILLQKLQFEPVLNTVINRLHIVSTVNKDFTTQNEAVISLINNRKQFLDFTIPKGGKVTSVARLRIPLRYKRKIKDLESGGFFVPITPSRNEDGSGYRVNISSNVKKDASFILTIKYNYPLQSGEMDMHGKFSLDPIQFGNIPVSYFTWDLGLPREYDYMNIKSNLVRKKIDESRLGIWHALLDLNNVNNAVIKQDAETGVIPSYDIQGKSYSFSRLSGDGYIKVEYLHQNWVYTLHLLIFLATWFIIAIIPKLKIISRINLSLLVSAGALLMSTLDLQGYGYTYIAILYGAGTSLVSAFIFGIARTKNTDKKEHTLYRDTSKSSEKNAESNDSKQASNEEIKNDK